MSAPVAVGIAAFVLAAALTEPLRRLALRLGLTDRPAGHKAHRTPTPYLAGLAIAAATLIPVAVAGRPFGAALATVLGGAAVLAVLGLVDDVRGLSARSRLAAETVLAAGVVVAGGRLLIGPRWIDALLTIGWIVVLTNAYNLLDNHDGALGTVAATTAVPLALTAVVGHQPHLALTFTALAAACAGFLLHNRPPARVFMGDSGSLFLGFLLAGGALLVRPGGRGYGHAAALLLVVFVALVDTAVVVLARWHAGRPVFRGGTDHAAHRLRGRGLRPYAVLAALAVAATTTGLLAALVRAGWLPGAAALAGVVLGAAGTVTLILRVPAQPAPAGPTIQPTTRGPTGRARSVAEPTTDERPERPSDITS